jgi:Icc-related predicted phosphoesterase
MRITLISDTHNKHNQITNDLVGGDLLLHSGDISSMGYDHEVKQFCEWLNNQDQYDNKVFIPGNHDWLFEEDPEKAKEFVNSYKDIKCLNQEWVKISDKNDTEDMVKIYGFPHTPWFHNWAFNVHRGSEEMLAVLNAIPDDVDILMSHGPAYGILDSVEGRRSENLGCQDLLARIKAIKPKIHLCGHIHTGYGYYFDGDTHFFNAAVLNEQYAYAQRPFTFDWNPETNTVAFL